MPPGTGHLAAGSAAPQIRTERRSAFAAPWQFPGLRVWTPCREISTSCRQHMAGAMCQQLAICTCVGMCTSLTPNVHFLEGYDIRVQLLQLCNNFLELVPVPCRAVL